MSNVTPENRDASDLQSYSAEIDAICDRFEAAWKAGQRPRIAAYLAELPEPGRAGLFRHLLALELHYRRTAGETPELGQYRERFPDFLAAVADAFPTIDSRPGVERSPAKTDRTPSPRALHIRCPHCRNPIEVVDDRPLAEIVCPSCGSNFSLIGDEALAFQSEGGSLHRRQAFGYFELIEQLGAGAFGTVWKAKDTQLDRTVAIKIPRKGQLSPEEAEKFVREARAAAQLQHPGIVSVYEVGRESETLYIVSEFVEGLSLADWLTGQRPTYREVAELCIKIADALHHAHEHGVVHRNLKPSNVMLDRAGEPHVMDFGLAKREAGEITMTVEGQIMGTPAYMSPEQAKGEGHTADRRSDVYSLGVVLFELTTGERPFRGNVRMLLVQVAGDEPPSPRKLDGRIPRDLETICLKCLEKDPTRRYQTAAEVAAELRRFLRGEPTVARPIGRPARLWRWCKRQPLVASLAAAIVLSLLLGMGVSSYFAITATAQRNRADENAAKAAINATTAKLKADEAGKERKRAEGALEKESAARLEAEKDRQLAVGALKKESAARQEAQRRAREANAMRLAAESQQASKDYPQRSLLLAGEAVKATVDFGQPTVVSAEQALRDAMSRIGGKVLSVGPDCVRCATVSPDGRWLAMSRFRTISLWDLWAVDPAAAPVILKADWYSTGQVAISPDNHWLAAASLQETRRDFGTSEHPIFAHRPSRSKGMRR